MPTIYFDNASRAFPKPAAVPDVENRTGVAFLQTLKIKLSEAVTRELEEICRGV